MAKGDKLTAPKLTLTMDTTTSKASKTVVKGKCPALGSGYVWFAPIGTAAVTADYKSVSAAHTAAKAAMEASTYDKTKAYKSP